MASLASLAVLLAVSSATTTVGPELVERFTVDDVRGPFAVGVNEVLVVRESRGKPRVLERRTRAGIVSERVELPCDAIDVAADERAWAILCTDRIVVERARFSNEPTRQIVELAPQSAPPSLLAVQAFHGSWIVAYEDGLVRRGRFDPLAGVEDIDLRARPLSLVLSGIIDATVALADGSQHAWRGSRVEDVTGPPRAHVELFDDVNDANGAPRARISRNVTSGSAVVMHSKHGALAVSSSSSRAIDALDVTHADDALCARSGTTLTCYGTPSSPPPEIAPRSVDDDDDDDDDDDAPSPQESDGVDEEFEPALDFGTPGAIAALVSTALGVGAFASAPFAMQALSPSLGIAPAFALAGLGAVAGVASFSVVASAVIIVGALIVVTMPDESSSTNAGVCTPGMQMLEGAVNDCICAIATIVGVVGALVATASIGVAALAVAAMPPVDVALGGRAPANEPFFATLGGAAAGSVVGFGVGAGVSFVTSSLRGEDDPLEPDDELATGLDSVQALSWVIGGSALGASLGYGLSRGP